MNLEKLTERLLKDQNATAVLAELSCIQTPDIEKKTSRREPILRRCLKFLQSAINDRNYSHIAPTLDFVRVANSIDDWLVSSSNIVLPQLKNLYCTILSEADPGSHHRPGTVNTAISSRIKRDKNAMRALCSFFEVCLGFCDLVDDDNQRHLGIFFKSSAAVLFGSDFQKKRDTLSETEYAMDELARYSSYTLSNIMLTYPAVVSMAENILGKRLKDLFNCLYSSPELGIKKSLILILRCLYQRYESNQDYHRYRSYIEEEFSRSPLGCKSALSWFKQIDLTSEDAFNQAENISSRMYCGEGDELCFKTNNCKIQVKELSENSRRRILFHSASVDWNRNSFAIHRVGELLPQYWPLFLVSNLVWKKGRKELHLELKECSQKRASRIVIRFRSEIDSVPKDAIEDRLLRIMENVKPDDGREGGDHATKLRKVSQVSMQALDFSSVLNVCYEAEPNMEHSNKEEKVINGMQHPTAVRLEHIFSETGAHKVYTNDSCTEDYSEGITQSSHAASGQEVEQVVGMTSPGNEYKTRGSQDSSSICKAADLTPLRDTAAGGAKSFFSVETSLENRCSFEGTDKTNPSGSGDVIWSQDEPIEDDEAISRDRQFVLSNTEVANMYNGSHKFLCKSGVNDNSGCHFHLGNGSDKGRKEIAQDLEMKDSELCFENKEEVKELAAQDEKLRQRLQTVIKNMIQWKQARTAHVLRKAKENITSVREHCGRRDEELLTKFANCVRKRSSLHIEKLTAVASRSKRAILTTRQRMSRMRVKLIEGRKHLKGMKTQSSMDIASGRDLMKKERKELVTRLETCMTSTQCRSESRERRNSVLQSVARLLNEK